MINISPTLDALLVAHSVALSGQGTTAQFQAMMTDLVAHPDFMPTMQQMM